MSTVKGKLTVQRVQPESRVIIQTTHKSFVEQKDGTFLPSSIKLMAVEENVKNPTYQWSYMLGEDWVEINNAIQSHYNVPHALVTNNSLPVRVVVSGNTNDGKDLPKQRVSDYIILEKVSYEQGEQGEPGEPGEPPGVAPFLSCLYSKLDYNFTVFSYS